MNAIHQATAHNNRPLRVMAGALAVAAFAFAATPAANAAPWNEPRYPSAAQTRPMVQGPVQMPRYACSTCGTVEAVSQFEHRGSASGAGAVAGGVLGAVLGNQMGKGSGSATATLIGAIGGGLLGHAIERKTAKETAYRMHVRMQDGSVRVVEQSAPVNVGTRVVFDGNTIQPDARGPRQAGYPQEHRRYTRYGGQL